jgi:chemotaxis protein CheX
MQATMLDQATLEQIVETVWSTMLQAPIRSLGPTADLATESSASRPAAGEAAPLTACVHIAGEWNGSVLLIPSQQFCRRAASIMLAIDAETASSADLQDCVAELCNIIGGGVKSIVPGPSSLSLPTVAFGSDYGLRIRRTQILADLTFESFGETLRLRVLEGEPTEQPA